MTATKDKFVRFKRIGRVAKNLGLVVLGALALNFQYFLIFLVVLAPLLYWSEVQSDGRDDEENARTQLNGIVDLDSIGTVVCTRDWNQVDSERVSQLREELLNSLDNSNQMPGNYRHLLSVVAREEDRSQEDFCQEVEGWFLLAEDLQLIRRHAYVTEERNLPFRFAFQHDGVIAPRSLQLTLQFPMGTEIWMDRAVENSENAGMVTPDLYNRRRIRLVSPLMQLDVFDIHTQNSKSETGVQLETSESGTTLVQTFSNVFVGNRCITRPFFISTTSSSEQIRVLWTATSSDLHGAKSGQIHLPSSQAV
jgi:hypothetical protein